MYIYEKSFIVRCLQLTNLTKFYLLNNTRAIIRAILRISIVTFSKKYEVIFLANYF